MAMDPFQMQEAAEPFNNLQQQLLLQLQAAAMQQQQENQQLHQFALQQQAIMGGAAALQAAQMAQQQQQQQQQAQLLAHLQQQVAAEQQRIAAQQQLQQLQPQQPLPQQPVMQPPPPQQLLVADPPAAAPPPQPEPQRPPRLPTPEELRQEVAELKAAMKPGETIPLPTLQKQLKRPRPRASKEEYIGVACHICSAAADGMHYKAISCRSCNAFFRRAVSYAHQYVCRHNNNCEITPKLRCACRACRYRKCLEAGMTDQAVQPPRDPTGSQKDRKKVTDATPKNAEIPYPPLSAREIIREQQIRDGAGTSSGSTAARRRGFADDDEEAEEMEVMDDILAELAEHHAQQQQQQQASSSMAMDVDDPEPPQRRPRRKGAGLASSSAGGRQPAARRRTAPRLPPLEGEGERAAFGEPPVFGTGVANMEFGGDDCAKIMKVISGEGARILHGITMDKYVDRPWEVESAQQGYERFQRLIICYREHTRMMQLAMTDIDKFLGQSETGIEVRQMVPADVSLLSTTELAGLLYWIEKMEPYSSLPACDRRALFKRYSVRKLSLDHFYTASRWTESCKVGHFVMLNNTFVPPNRTGFELETDDDRQIKAKAEILLPTFEQMWRCVIWPFAKMKITDAEMVFLHTLLLWSPLNNMHVTIETKEKMGRLREAAINMMFQHYTAIGQDEAPVRFGEIVHLLAEIEVICDRHCQDFQVAKLFEFCDMSQFWYEKWCYSAPLRPDYLEPVMIDVREMRRRLEEGEIGEQPGPAMRDEYVNTMQVPAAACHSPLRNELNETASEMYDRELMECLAEKEQRKCEEDARMMKEEQEGEDYVVPPAKRANLARTPPSAPSTTPSTPHPNPSLQSDQ